MAGAEFPYVKLVSLARFFIALFLCALHILLFAGHALADEVRLETLIDEALKNSPEILMAEAKWKASGFRVPQAKSLPDPMFMFGYQNEGWSRYTYGEMEGAQWMFSASQMFPYYGKRELKGEMASRDAGAARASHESVRLKTIARVKELYFDLYAVYKELDLLEDKTALFIRIEEAANARYSAGMGMQQEVLMAQSEKYMILEKKEMARQKIRSLEAMLNAVIGKDSNAEIGRPADTPHSIVEATIDELQKKALEHSPELLSGSEMVAAADAKVRMAKREFYPDFTLAASYFKRGGDFEDMWSFTSSFNIPIFYKSRQQQAVLEAEALHSEATHNFESMKFMIFSAIRDNYFMVKTADRLMELYKDGLIPKTYQDFESSLAGYTTGGTEALTVITRLKSLIDYEMLYWGQFAEREKSIARIVAITGKGM